MTAEYVVAKDFIDELESFLDTLIVYDIIRLNPRGMRDSLREKDVGNVVRCDSHEISGAIREDLMKGSC